jgi:S-adenosyl-L-methionine hydrolase (adenosine-forming)
MRIITLLTDYGLRDSYVAEMKGAILKINPAVTLVDISHLVNSYDIHEGAFHLARSVKYFPDSTIHVAVVDPGVGSNRASLIFETSKAYLVGPDNGLLAPAAERLGVIKVYKIIDRRILPERLSDIFDGRDTFGPVAAHLSQGESPKSFGPETNKYVRIPTYSPPINIDDELEASVIHVDSFGNLVTNVTNDVLNELGASPGSEITLLIGDKKFSIPYVRSFSAVSVGELLALVAGGGYMEISVNQGNAQKVLGVKRDGRIRMSVVRKKF